MICPRPASGSPREEAALVQLEQESAVVAEEADTEKEAEQLQKEIDRQLVIQVSTQVIPTTGRPSYFQGRF